MTKGHLLAKGATAEIFAYGDTQVLKLFHVGRPLGQARYEARVGALIHAAGVPSPAVLALTEANKRGGVIYERVGGPSMDKTLEAEPWRLIHLARRFATVHAALHRASVLGLPSQRSQLAGRINKATPLPEDLKRAALAALKTLPAGQALCHGDFHPGNLLLSPSGPVVIDWENAASGDPAADVARTLLLLRMAHHHFAAGATRYLLRVGLALFSAIYLSHYCRRTNASPERIAAWQLPVVAARLSEGVGLEEVYLLKLAAHLC